MATQNRNQYVWIYAITKYSDLIRVVWKRDREKEWAGAKMEKLMVLAIFECVALRSISSESIHTRFPNFKPNERIRWKYAKTNMKQRAWKFEESHQKYAEQSKVKQSHA